MLDLAMLANECQQHFQTEVVRALIDIESSEQPLAVAVIGIDNFFQPSSLTNGIKMLNSLDKRGIKYSAGLMQVTKDNFKTYKLTNYSVFEPCENIRAGTEIFYDCFSRSKKMYPKNTLLENYRNSASCYYTGNFKSGYVLPKNKPYVTRFEESLNKWIKRKKNVYQY